MTESVNDRLPLDGELAALSTLNPCSGNSHSSTSLPLPRLDTFTKISGVGHEELGEQA